MLKRDLVLQIKELMERTHNNVNEIAHRLNMDPATVQMWIDTITDMFS